MVDLVDTIGHKYFEHRSDVRSQDKTIWEFDQANTSMIVNWSSRISWKHDSHRARNQVADNSSFGTVRFLMGASFILDLIKETETEPSGSVSRR